MQVRLADPATPKQSAPSTTPRWPVPPSPSTCVARTRGGPAGVAGGSTEAPIRPWCRRDPAWSWASVRSRPTGTAPPIRRRSRTRSTWTGRQRGPGVGRTLLEELVALAAQHGFHAIIARIVGDNEASHRAAPGVRVRAGRRGAGDRSEVQPLARLLGAPAHALRASTVGNTPVGPLRPQSPFARWARSLRTPTPWP